MRRVYGRVFTVIGAVMIWLGVKLLIAAISAAALTVGAVMVFAGMRIITRSIEERMQR